MTLKPVEDILGGAESWKNVDKTEGEFSPSSTTLIIDEEDGVCSDFGDF